MVPMLRYHDFAYRHPQPQSARRDGRAVGHPRLGCDGVRPGIADRAEPVRLLGVAGGGLTQHRRRALFPAA